MMTRRRVGWGAIGLAWAALSALPALASDVELEPSAMEPASEAAEPSGEAGSGWVKRAAFTTAVMEREPQDEIRQLTNDFVEVFFFTELRGFQGETVTHRWEYGGEVVAEVPIQVGGPRWRAHSSKQLDPEQLGEWTASVVDASGRVIESQSFVYDEAMPPADAEMPAAAAPSP
jgi:hypothetical protein